MERGVLVYVLSVVVAGVVAQWLGWRIRIPPIILLLATGIALGPVGGLIDPGRDLGHLQHPLIGLVVAIIVFEGGLNLRFGELRAAGHGVGRLVLLALPLNWIFGTLAAHWVGGLPWGVATLLGAILVVTGPTVILPLLRQARLAKHPAALLKWEAVVNDPVGAILTVVILQVLLSHRDPGVILLHVLPSLAGSVALGAATAWAVRGAFRADWIPENLRLPMLLAGALGLHAVGNAVYPEAGLVAATTFGIALANLPAAGLEQLVRTQEALTVLLVSSLFILLSADIDRTVAGSASWRLAAFVAAVMLVVRPLSIVLATLRDHMDWRERLLLAWIAPRGIVAAAISGLVGGQLVQAGLPGGEMLQPMVLAVIVVTVLVQGMMLAPLSRWLGLRNSERPGLLVVGMSPWALALARVVSGHGVPVVVADRSWQALRPARDAGLRTAAVEVLSERVDDMVEASGMDYLLAASDDDAYNALVCARLAPELGRERVHQLALGSNRLDRHSMPGRNWRGKVVADSRLDFQTANELLDEGWHFAGHPVSSGTDGKLQALAEGETVLLTIHSDGALEFHSPERAARLSPGDVVITFLRRPRPAGPR